MTNIIKNGSYKTICRGCHGGCGVIADVKEGRVTAIRGDIDNPNNRGKLCAKGKASLELLNHSRRLTQPIKRVGRKGDGAFEPISWDEALTHIADRLGHYKKEWGAESVVLCQGTDRNYQEWLFRFANAFGTPNILGPAHVCFYPRVMASIMTFGSFTFCDYEAMPEWIVSWGSNKDTCSSDGVIGSRQAMAIKQGSRLIVIDPYFTALSKQAAYWLRIRPGTDIVLALGMLHIILEEDLYDTDFVKGYTHGFDALVDHLAPYTPEHVAEITSVPEELLREATVAYATAQKACIEIGSGIEQTVHSFSCARAINLIMGLCGYLDAPGGNVIWEPMNVEGRRRFPLFEVLPEEAQRKRLGADQNKILDMAGWVSPHATWEAILKDEPYPVKAMLVFGSNLLLSYADSQKVWDALNALDFLVVADLFLTPTAQLADIVLPVSSWLERDELVEFNSFLAARRKLQVHNGCKSDEDILLDLAHRLNLEHFGWNSMEEALDFRLKPLGLDWKGFVDKAYLPNTLSYYKHREGGFRTRNGKFNIVSDGLKHFGYSQLPTYDIKKVRVKADALLVTSRRSRYYFNSEYRQLSSLRFHEPNPVIELHPETAARYGIDSGDWVDLMSDDKTMTYRAVFSDAIDPEVVSVVPLWWCPEQPNCSSWKHSNINMLTNERQLNPEMATPNLRGIYCSIKKSINQEGVKNG